MSYTIQIEKSLELRLQKMKKKDSIIYTRVVNKIGSLGENPYIGKPLKRVLKGKWRVHIGSFVLIYTIDEVQGIITFLEFEHHDRAYK